MPTLIRVAVAKFHTLAACTLAMLTCSVGWHDEDVEQGACDPVFTSLIPHKDLQVTKRKGKKTSHQGICEG